MQGNERANEPSWRKRNVENQHSFFSRLLQHFFRSNNNNNNNNNIIIIIIIKT